MASTPVAGPSGVASLAAQAPSSSLPGFHEAPPSLRISRPSWIVRTESNIRRERPKRPDPPCTICKGTGKIDCRNCFGRGTYMEPGIYRENQSCRSCHAPEGRMATMVPYMWW